MTAAQTQTSLRLTRHIRAPRQKVFDAWIRSELVSRWMGPGPVKVQSVDLDARVGGRYRIVMDNDGTEHIATGEYVEIVPGRKLSMTWGWEGPARYDTLLTVLFEDKDGGTDLTLIHERFATADEMGHHEHGWIGSLDKLAAAVEQNTR